MNYSVVSDDIRVLTEDAWALLSNRFEGFEPVRVILERELTPAFCTVWEKEDPRGWRKLYLAWAVQLLDRFTRKLTDMSPKQLSELQLLSTTQLFHALLELGGVDVSSQWSEAAKTAAS